MLIWVLFMVLISPIPGLESLTFLNQFNTSEECHTERERIAVEMAKAYPHDTDYRIECRTRQTTKHPIGLMGDDGHDPQYDALIMAFGKQRFPQTTLDIRVLNIKSVQNESGLTPIVAIQVHMFHKDGGKSFIIFIKQNRVLAWIDVGEVVTPEDDEEEEVFIAKDRA